MAKNPREKDLYMKKTKAAYHHQRPDMEDEEGGLVLAFHMDAHVSPSSSPPTPPSPLPVSLAPGNLKYYFSPSPSSSPPFSPPSSAHASAESLPLLSHKLATHVPSAFSLDRPPLQHLDSAPSSCLQDLLEWFIQKCCNCCFKIHGRAD